MRCKPFATTTVVTTFSCIAAQCADGRLAISRHPRNLGLKLAAHRRVASPFVPLPLFNPTDARPAHYNPLLDVRRDTDEVRDVQNIANLIVGPEGALDRCNHWKLRRRWFNKRKSVSALLPEVLIIIRRPGRVILDLPRGATDKFRGRRQPIDQFG